MNTPRFLTQEHVDYISQNFQWPHYVYSEVELRKSAQAFLDFPSAYGHTVRYAMKANPQRNILKLFSSMGLFIDASTDFEAIRAIHAGVEPHMIQISSQELWLHAKELIEKWVFFVATSLHQLEFFGKNFPGNSCGIRINPGVSSGGFAQISTGGKNSSFGIWHKKIQEIQAIAEEYDITITKLHFHIGSENTPESWVDSAELWFDILRDIETIEIFDMWGGHKKAIMDYEKSADLDAIGAAISQKFEDFYKETDRKIHLEMEPGKYLVINACSMVTSIQDIVDTGRVGHVFLKTNSGMNDMPRVPMYGIQEPLFVMNNQTEYQDYVVVGHCCESSDILTCKLYDAETIEPRSLKTASIWDALVVDGVWWYNSSMSMKNYNSFPESGELLLTESGEIREIRSRQKLEDIWKDEIVVL